MSYFKEYSGGRGGDGAPHGPPNLSDRRTSPAALRHERVRPAQRRGADGEGCREPGWDQPAPLAEDRNGRVEFRVANAVAGEPLARSRPGGPAPRSVGRASRLTLAARPLSFTE